MKIAKTAICFAAFLGNRELHRDLNSLISVTDQFTCMNVLNLAFHCLANHLFTSSTSDTKIFSEKHYDN